MVNQNFENHEMIKFYKDENHKLQIQVEELTAKLQCGLLDGAAN
jgi:hypothetical protein